MYKSKRRTSMRGHAVPLLLAALLAALTACQAGAPGDRLSAQTQTPASYHKMADTFEPREVNTDLGRVPVDWPWRNELDPRALDCTTDQAVISPGGLQTGTAARHPTPGRAVEAWLEQRAWLGLTYKVAPSGSTARVLRPDGTVLAQVHLVTKGGYIVHGFVACIEPK